MATVVLKKFYENLTTRAATQISIATINLATFEQIQVTEFDNSFSPPTQGLCGKIKLEQFAYTSKPSSTTTGGWSSESQYYRAERIVSLLHSGSLAPKKIRIQTGAGFESNESLGQPLIASVLMVPDPDTTGNLQFRIYTNLNSAADATTNIYILSRLTMEIFNQS
jgi:hypothetical protein